MKTEAFAKTYNGRKVLDLPAITLRSGAVTAVIGANGSGKSTMAKILSGIEAADENKRAEVVDILENLVEELMRVSGNLPGELSHRMGNEIMIG